MQVLSSSNWGSSNWVAHAIASFSTRLFLELILCTVLSNKVLSQVFYLWNRSGIFGFCFLSFPQNERKIYKLRLTKLSQLVYFSLIWREREETKTKYSEILEPGLFLPRIKSLGGNKGFAKDVIYIWYSAEFFSVFLLLFNLLIMVKLITCFHEFWNH